MKTPEQREKAMGAGGNRVLVASPRCRKDPGVGSPRCQVRPWSGQERGQRGHGDGDVVGEGTSLQHRRVAQGTFTPLCFWEMLQVTPQRALEWGAGVHQPAGPLPEPPATEGPQRDVTLQGSHDVPTSGPNPRQGCR